jgi:hypothetical protein
MKYIFTLLFACLLFQVNGQKKIDNVFQKQNINVVSSTKVKSNLNTLVSGQLLSLSDFKGQEIFNTEGAFLLQVPLKTGFVEVELEVANIFSPNFKVMTPNGEVAVELPHYYHGKIKGDPKSFVALTITKDAIEGMITNDKLNLTIGRVMNTKEKLHVVYNTDELPNNTPICSEPVEVPFDGDLPELQPNSTNAAGCKAVEIYLEADNQMYLDWGGSVQTVVNTMTAVFNNVSLLYDNEGLNLVISTLFVWTTPDPYRTALDTSQSLNLLDAYWNGQGNNFDGDIVHLVTTKQLGGGIANLLIGTSVFNGMTQRAVFANCGKGSAKGMSGSIVNSVVNVPTYSWNVQVIAHEIGHNFGLPHTHSCTWSNGTTTGAIDNCATTEGGCAGGPAPTNGGTIMSYCHTTAGGINFANGFGPLPSGKMNAEFNAAACLSGSKVPRPIVANQSLCSSQSVQLTASGCTGTYQWFDAAVNGTSLSTTNTYTTPVLTASTSYYVNCTLNGCVSRRRKVDVNIFNSTVSPTVQDVTLCGNNASAVLIANCNGAIINWYSALTGGNPIGTGNNFVLNNINANTTVYAECSQTGCGASPRTALQITLTAQCPYCEPNGLNCNDSDVITQVKIDQGATNLYTNSSTCSNSGFALYTPVTPIAFTAAQTYSITTTTLGVYQDGLAIWIDYNSNGIFEASEKVESYDPNAIWTTRETNIAIPVTVTAGVTRMRVKVSYLISSNDPCSSSDGSGYGEIEDYIITLSTGGGSPCPPTLSHATGVLPAGNYNAGQTINSQANVSTATKYQAGKHIMLNAGFQAGSNKVFEAKIAGCPE